MAEQHRSGKKCLMEIFAARSSSLKAHNLFNEALGREAASRKTMPIIIMCTVGYTEDVRTCVEEDNADEEQVSSTRG